jgi:hypothetical protein
MSDTLIYSPDGKLAQTVNFSTTRQTRFFDGTLPLDAAELLVSINGSGFSGDASLAQWGDGVWTVPNPLYEPDGVVLLEGVNTIEVKAILGNGTTTPTAKATVRLTTDEDVSLIVGSPTNVSVEQNNDSVTIRAEAPEETAGFQWINYYASANAGGGVTGYTRINVSLVSEGETRQETAQFATQAVDVPVQVDADGNPTADPMYYRLTGRQEDEDEAVLVIDYNERYEIPETARTLRLNMTLDQVRDVVSYDFTHNRQGTPQSTPATVRVSEFVNRVATDPLYYTVTAIFYDTATNTEYESAYSTEVVGLPMQVTTAMGSIPTVSRQNIVTEFVKAIFRSNPQIKVEAGSVLRDTVIDPYSSESERLRFLLDFYQRARTPTLLLQIDDPTGSGTSIPVAQSTYKRALQSALYLESALATQGLIDSAFEAYCSNFGVVRRSGVGSRGEVLFYTRTKPQSSLVIPLGTIVSGGSSNFATTRAATISASQIASYYNPVNGFYQIAVLVQATTTGSVTNLGTGQVTTVVSTLGTSLAVTNLAAMVGGQDGESNLALTARVQNRLASVDSGTARGYLQTAADVPGVIKANVVAAGNPLMQRDLSSDGEHKGGKVDIWVQGTNPATVTDNFAFTFEIAQDIQFQVLSVAELTFLALDTDLTAADPIVEMLNDPDIGYEMRNASTGEVFDLTGVTITAYNTIQLDTSIPQPAVDLTDVVLASYRRRSGSRFTLLRQPVEAITSVVGSVSGELPPEAYLLVHPDAPLSYGRSTLADDFLQIDGYTDSSGNTIPTGDTLVVTDESHVMVGQYAEFLDSLGANYLTIVVKSADGLITYAGPNDPSGVPDYQITLGTQTVAVSITRTEASAIPNGATVLVSYEHDENFTVTYTTNLIVSTTQNAVDLQKHATADVVVKDSIPAPLDIEATVVVQRGRETSTVDTDLRTNMANFFNNLRLGDPVRQSDIIDVIEQTDGVSYVVVPLSKMVRQRGGTVVREDISTDTVSESVLLTALSTNTSIVYILTESLSAATVDGGGEGGEFRAVFQDEVSMDLLAASTTLISLGTMPGAAYIVGSDGVVIEGYSDDATLQAQGYVTDKAITQQRKALTANRVLVSVAPGDAPTEHLYAATYVVGEDAGARNIEPGGAEYCSQGFITITYDEDR